MSMSGERPTPTPPPAAQISSARVWTLAAKCLIVTLVVFALAQAIEMRIADRVAMETVHVLHAVQGLVAALAVAVVVHRHHDVPWSRPTEDPYPLAAEDPTQTAHSAAWFIALRWFAVAVIAAAVVTTGPVIGILPHEVRGPLILLTLTLAGSNVLYTRVLPRFGDRTGFLVLQIVCDLAILTMLLHFSGGLENPLGSVYIFHVILAGILLSRTAAYAVAVSASAMFASLAALELSGIVGHYTLSLHPHAASADLVADAEEIHSSLDWGFVASHVVVMSLLLLCTTYFTTLLSERLRRTERQRLAMAREAIAEKQRLEGVVEASGAGLAIVSADGSVDWRNERAEDWLQQLAASEQSAETPAPADLAAAALATGVVQEHEVAIALDSRMRLHLHLTARPVEGAGSPHVALLVQDVTARRTAESALLQTSKLAAIGELAGNVAHEVNNPVGVISAKARLLLQRFGPSEMPEKVREDLAKIIQYADRIAGITGGLLTFARRSSGTKAAVDLNAAVRNAVDFLEPRIRRSGVEIGLDLGSDLPRIHGLSNELQQLVVNLASNALDATPSGARVEIVTAVIDGDVVLRVSDTGRGIPDAVQAAIFEPFFTTRGEGEGTGLGLSICHGIARDHDAVIEVSSAEGVGTSFRVSFPIPRTDHDG